MIAILSLLVSILLPSLQKARDLAKMTACVCNLRNAGLGLSLYVQNNNDDCPCWLVTENTCHPTNPDRDMPWYEYMYSYFDLPGSPGVGKLWCTDLSQWEEYRKLAGALVCPSSETPKFCVVDYGMNVLLGSASGKGGNYYATSYISPTNLGFFCPGDVDKPADIFWLGDSKDYWLDRMGHCDYRHNEGLNLLFVDGHSELYNEELPVYDLNDRDCLPWL